jgi:two-component sensor histidine kinase
MLLATWQAFAGLERDARQQRAELERAADLTTMSEQNVLLRARSVLNLLAANPDVRSATQGRCGPALDVALRQFRGYSHFGLMGPEGVITCSTSPAALGMKVNNLPLWAQLKTSGFAVMSPARGQVSNRTILAAVLPLKTAAGGFDGILVASIDLEWTKARLVDRYADVKTVVAIVDSQGRVVAGSEALPWQQVPLSGAAGIAHEAKAADGQPWSFAHAPLHTARGVGESYHVVYAVPQPRLFGTEWWFAAGYFALPLLALLLASAAIWVGANRAILRWIEVLGQVASDIGRGTYRLHDDLFADAPTEIRGLAAELYQMARVIDARDRKLVEAANHERMLALEVHHRVRNNLQILGSFLSLQADRLADGEARRALQDARLRVSALGLVHRLLYDSGELTTVSTSALLGPLSETISAQPALAGRVDVSCELQDHAVTIDVAVPLTLWLVEAATLLLDRGLAGDVPARLSLALQKTAHGIDMVVEATGLAPAGETDALRRRLVDGIARQLGGVAAFENGHPDMGVATLSIPLETLARSPLGAVRTAVQEEQSAPARV